MQEIFIIIASLVQGVLEFLPVSSSAHLSFVESYLRIEDFKNIKFFLELATFLVVLFYFRGFIVGALIGLFSESKKDSFVFFAKLALPCLPFAIAFPFLHNSFQNISLFLILGSILMIISEIIFKKRGFTVGNLNDISFKQAFLIGCFQVLAIFSGFSRSGSTICGGLICGLSRSLAVRFSFLVSLPLTFASLCYDFYKIKPYVNSSSTLAFISCLIIASIAIKPCFKFLSSFKLTYFAIYRIFIATLLIYFL